MSLLKNINKEFVLDKNYKYLSDKFHYLASKQTLDSIQFGKTKVRVNEIDMKEITFSFTEIEKIDEVANRLSELMSDRLISDANKFKKIASKVIEAWEKNPDSFKKKDSYGTITYKNPGLLNSSEYHTSVFAFFGKISYHSKYSFSTGHGSDTYYNKKFYVDAIDSIDSWVNKTVKEIKSSKVKLRIKNTLLKSGLSVDIKKVEDLIVLSNEKSEAKSKKARPKFPLNLTAREMNYVLCELEGFVTQEIVDSVKEERNIDLSPILDWEISIEHEGYHHNDGQICDYTATFTSPEGFEYYIYDSHSLMTGWNLSKLTVN